MGASRSPKKEPGAPGAARNAGARRYSVFRYSITAIRSSVSLSPKVPAA